LRYGFSIVLSFPRLGGGGGHLMPIAGNLDRTGWVTAAFQETKKPFCGTGHRFAENCHGPGLSHVAKSGAHGRSDWAQLQKRRPKLFRRGWRTTSACPCHHTGDARVLAKRKDIRDFSPGGGAELDNTPEYFPVPFYSRVCTERRFVWSTTSPCDFSQNVI